MLYYVVYVYIQKYVYCKNAVAVLCTMHNEKEMKLVLAMKFKRLILYFQTRNNVVFFTAFCLIFIYFRLLSGIK